MCRMVFVFSVFLFLSCNSSPVKEPKKLLDQEIMENILYDVAIYNAAHIHNAPKIQEQGLSLEQFIYKKYKIDSLTYYQNNAYYASNVKKYNRMFDNIQERVETELAERNKKLGIKENKKTNTNQHNQVVN